MTLITFSDGKVIMKGGAVGTETSCCCGTPCVCPSLTLNVNFRITFDRAYGICGVVEFTSPINFTISEVITCSNGAFETFTDIDISLCDPEQSCSSVRIFWNIIPPCDCTNTSVCDVELGGWEEVSCAGGITNVEIV